jgi:predicted transcriptional regulator
MEDIESRRRIYEEIIMNPGLHFRELQRRLNMHTGMLEYHLNVMEKDGLIISKLDGKYRRFFANTVMTSKERHILGILRNNVARVIVIFVLQNGKVRHSDIVEHTKLSPSTVSYHLNKLIKNNILEREVRGRENYYSVVDPTKVANTIIKHKKSFLDTMVDNFAKIWGER